MDHEVLRRYKRLKGECGITVKHEELFVFTYGVKKPPTWERHKSNKEQGRRYVKKQIDPNRNLSGENPRKELTKNPCVNI